MANNPKLSNAAANAAVDAVCALLDGGSLRLYDGTQAADADTAIGAQVLLAELPLGTPAFGAAVDGVADAEPITDDADADATGTATWFRAVQSDGVTVVFDGTVGTSGADLNLNSVSIVEDANVEVTGFSYTQSKG